MDFTVIDPQTAVLKIGRGIVCINKFDSATNVPKFEKWDPTDNLELMQLGVTEGDITIEFNEDVANLTLPETSGPAVLEATHVGDNPVVSFPMFVADPDLLDYISPRGSGSGGYSRVDDVVEHTLVVFPETLYRVASTTTPPGAPSYETLSFTGGSWTLGGEALTTAKEALLDQTFWVWRGYFSRPTRMFKGDHGDEGKNLYDVTFNSMMHPGLPEGHRLFTTGDPADYSIDIEGGS